MSTQDVVQADPVGDAIDAAYQACGLTAEDVGSDYAAWKRREALTFIIGSLLCEDKDAADRLVARLRKRGYIS